MYLKNLCPRPLSTALQGNLRRLSNVQALSGQESGMYVVVYRYLIVEAQRQGSLFQFCFVVLICISFEPY